MFATIENKDIVVAAVVVSSGFLLNISAPVLDEKKISPSVKEIEVLRAPYSSLSFMGRETFVSDVTSNINDVHLSTYIDAQVNTDWRGVIMTSNERRVIEALANPKWDFRTVKGLTIETGFDRQYIEGVLKKFPQLIRCSDVPDKNGRLLYTLSDRPKMIREKLALLRIFLTKSL